MIDSKTILKLSKTISSCKTDEHFSCCVDWLYDLLCKGVISRRLYLSLLSQLEELAKVRYIKICIRLMANKTKKKKVLF